MAELTNQHIRTPQEIAIDGGRKGPKVPLLPKERTGDDAVHEWEEKHGKLNIPAYLRKPKPKRTGRETFSDQ